MELTPGPGMGTLYSGLQLCCVQDSSPHTSLRRIY